MRITNNIIFNTALTNLQKQSERLLRAQDEASSGKRVDRPSDDPVSTRRILDLRGALSSFDQFKRNRTTLDSFLQVTDNALDNLGTLLVRVKELAIAQANATATPETMAITAKEIASLFEHAVQIGNTEVGGRYIFAGYAGDRPPFSSTGSFTGDDGQLQMAINARQTIPLNIVGSQFLVADLHPNIDPATPLTSLRQGEGISAGSLKITDRGGGTAIVDLSGAATVGDVLHAISGAFGVHVSASINEAGNGIVMTDNTPFPTRNLTIEEVNGGKTASELGIAADRSGPIVGTPLNPLLTPSTPLSLLYRGRGVNLTAIHIANGATETDVDLSTAQTIGEVLAAIHAAATNVTASINTDGTALEVRSNDPAAVAIVTEVNGGTTASDLGIQGSQNILKTLSLFQEALEKNDQQAIENLLPNIDKGLDQVLELRADVGARTNRVELVGNSLEELQLTVTTLLSQTEDADVLEVFSRLSNLTVAFQAALGATARIIQPTLLDFLR